MATALGSALWPAFGEAASVKRVPSADIPIRLLYNRPWTGVWIEKQGPFRFQISTATNLATIWLPLAQRIGLQAVPGDGYLRKDFDPQYSTLYRAKEAVIGGGLGLTRYDLASFRDEGQPAFMGDLPLLPDRVTAFQFGEGLMRYLPDGPPVVADFAKVALTYNQSFLAWTPQVVCKLGGRSVKLRIDTASPGGVELYSEAVRRYGLWDAPGAYYERVERVGAADYTTRVTRRGDFELGGVRFEQPAVILHDPKNSGLYGYDDDGRIGMEVLRRLDIVIDQPRRDLWLRPTAAMADPWRHDRAGFDVDFQGGQRRIVRVDTGSPAAMAGLAVGDVLPDFDAEGELRLREGQCGKAGLKLTFEVERAGARRKMSMVLQDRV